MIDLFNVGIKTVVLIIIKCDSLKTKKKKKGKEINIFP